MSTLRFGLAGLGTHGSRYARHLLRGDVEGAALGAVCRADADAGESFAREHGLTFVRDPRELAALPGLDAVIAVLPPDLHAATAAACLTAGRAVLVEKPMTADVPAAVELEERAAASRVPLMVAHTLRFDPLVEAIRGELPRLGPLRLVAINQRFEPTTRGWIDVPGRGGAVLNTGVHGFDLLRLFTGAEPASVVAETARVVTRRTEDEFACVFRFEPGDVTAMVDNARTTTGRSGRIEIAGRHGQIRADHIHRWLVRIEGRSEVDLGPVLHRPTVVETLRAFTRCVRGAAPPPVTASDGRAAVEMAHACLLAAGTGRRVRIDEVRGKPPRGAPSPAEERH